MTLDRGVDAFYLVGTIGWRDPPPGGVLNVSGTIDESAGPEHQRFNLTAFGRQDTATDGWEYEYHGHMGRNWAMPDGSRVDRHPTLVGSVIRVRPHGDRKAGEVFSFIAVKPQQLDRETTYDLTGSWTYRSFHNNTKYPYLKAPPRRPSSSSKPSSKLSRQGGTHMRPHLAIQRRPCEGRLSGQARSSTLKGRYSPTRSKEVSPKSSCSLPPGPAGNTYSTGI